MIARLFLTFCLITVSPAVLGAQQGDTLRPQDVFELERAVDARISPDGSRIVYVRTGFDVMTDRAVSQIWMINSDGSDHRPLTNGAGSFSQPRWAPDGNRLAFVATIDDDREIYVRWMDTGQQAKLTNVTESPGGIAWSPDGNWLAFTMFVPDDPGTLHADMPERPEGADWGPSITVIDQLTYRADGRGYLDEGNTHVLILPADGGTPRQLTDGAYDHSGTPSWLADGSAVVVSGNRHEDAEREPRNSEVYAVSVADGSILQLTDRHGPDDSPRVSPNGHLIAYTGFDDRYQGYQVNRLYVMDVDGSNRRELTADFDRSVGSPRWDRDNRHLYFRFTEEGVAKVARISLGGEVEIVVDGMGGLSMGRPYSSAQYTLASDGRVAFALGSEYRPADVGIARRRGDTMQLTHLNDDLLAHKQLGEVEEIWYQSRYDGRRIQGWIVKPPDFDPSLHYPLILEIHGGPFASYGPWFSPELQLYAAAGYVVLYTNPRGSTSYGEEFGNLIHHAYPGNDFDDLMSGVDAVLDRGYVDPGRLFVTGGSGGGVLSAWIVGHTDRFRAAAVQKPVINWYSFVLNSDNPAFFYRYWFPGPPWEQQEHSMARSPIAYVGNVTTPTMLITGERDYRTPMSETEQFYGALQIRGVEAAMVRVPDASHGIAGKASNMIAKVQYVLGWFDRFREEPLVP
ncbi:MAG: prolyl oligopeptidase family serine peptidase [Gemmatimonadales bacterium]